MKSQSIFRTQQFFSFNIIKHIEFIRIWSLTVTKTVSKIVNDYRLSVKLAFIQVPCVCFEENRAQTRTFSIYYSLLGEIIFLSTDTKRIYLILHAIFIFLNIQSRMFLVSAILHHISLLRLQPKSYIKIRTFQPNFLCSSSFKLE